jgi:hypothetical protein
VLAGRGNPIKSYQLSGGSSSGRSVSVTPTTSNQDVQFSLNDIPDTELIGARTEFVQIVGFRLGVQFVFDQAASGGSVVNADKLKKILNTVQLQSQLLGVGWSAQHNKGAAVGHFDQVLANGWFDPQPHRAQLASADGDTTCYYEAILPVALGCFAVPEDFALPTCCFAPGQLVLNGFKSTVFDGDSAGAVIKTVVVTAEALYLLTPDPTIGVPHQFAEYAPPGSSNNPELTGIGQTKGFNGQLVDQSVCGLAALVILGNATGIGLGGAAGPDNLLSIDIPGLRIRNHTDPRAFQRNARLTLPSTNFGHRAGNGSTIEHDAADGLYTQAATPNDPLDAQGKWFQISAPVDGQQSSKVDLWATGSPLKINLTTTSTVANVFRTLELLRWSEYGKDLIQAAMGFPQSKGYRRRPKLAHPHGGPVPSYKAMFLPDEIYR